MRKVLPTIKTQMPYFYDIAKYIYCLCDAVYFSSQIHTQLQSLCYCFYSRHNLIYSRYQGFFLSFIIH